MSAISTALAVIASAYLAIAVLLFLFQRHLLYRPDTARTPPAAAGLANVNELELRTPDCETLIAWSAPAQPGRPTLLYFHGNGGSLAMRAERIKRFTAVGYGVFMMSYRGYSGSTGKPSEKMNIADAALAYEHLRLHGVQSEAIILYGESLGSGVAVQLAVEKTVGGIILDAPYTSIADVAARGYGIFPVKTFLLDHYDSMPFIGRIRAPLLVLHGRRDAVVPLALGERLFARAPQPKIMRVFEEGGHSDLYAHGALDDVVNFIERFITDKRRAASGHDVNDTYAASAEPTRLNPSRA